jgi:hypothetical protein
MEVYQLEKNDEFGCALLLQLIASITLQQLLCFCSSCTPESGTCQSRSEKKDQHTPLESVAVIFIFQLSTAHQPALPIGRKHSQGMATLTLCSALRVRVCQKSVTLMAHPEMTARPFGCHENAVHP